MFFRATKLHNADQIIWFYVGLPLPYGIHSHLDLSIPRIIIESDDSFHCHRNLRRRCQIPTVFVLRKKTKIRNVPEKNSPTKKDVQNSS